MSLSESREFEMLLQDSSRMTYFLDFLMDNNAHNLLMFWLEAEQFAEFTGDASSCFEQAKALIDRYIGLEPKPNEDDVIDSNHSEPRTTIALTKEIKSKLRGAVALNLDSNHNVGDSDDEDGSYAHGYFPFTGVIPEDEEEKHISGVAALGYRAPTLETKCEVMARIKCASCDLFTDAQAMVSVQLFRDWYGKFQKSSSYKRLCESLLTASNGPFDKHVNVETLLDTSIAVRRVVESFLDSTVCHLDY